MENYIDELLKTIEFLGQPNWLDYLQVIASVLSIIISAWAVIMAIKIPQKIANKQDKIALFNKRFSAHSILQKYVVFASLIKRFTDMTERKIFIEMFLTVFFDGNKQIHESKNEIIELTNISIPLKHMPFLFENISVEEIEEMIGSLTDLIFTITGDFDIKKSKQKYIEVVEQFNAKHSEEILASLKM